MYCIDLFLLERKKEAEPNCKTRCGIEVLLDLFDDRGSRFRSKVEVSVGHARAERQRQQRVSGAVAKGVVGGSRGREGRWVH